MDNKIPDELRTELLKQVEVLSDAILSGQIRGLLVLSMSPTMQLNSTLCGLNFPEAIGMVEFIKLKLLNKMSA